MKINKYKQLIAAVLLGISASSQAGLISAGPFDIAGAGLGNVNTILTLHNSNDPAGEANGTIAFTPGGDVPSGAEVHQQSATFSFGQLNVTNLNQLLLVFNPNERGNTGNNGLILDTLTLSIFTDGGVFKQLFNLDLGPVTYTESETGVGTAGYGFKLDPLLALPAISATDRIGLSARLLLADGGLDTFFVTRLDDGEGPQAEIPEPGSLALLGLGIAGLAALRRRRT